MLLQAASAASGGVQGWTAAELPSPALNPSVCGRPHRSLLCDPDRLLSEDQAGSVEALLSAAHLGSRGKGAAAFPDAPACGGAEPRGWQLSAVLVRRAGGAGSAALRAERLARGLHDAWGVGDACGSGALLLVALDERQLYISTGAAAQRAAGEHGLEAALEEMRPLLRQGDTAAALLQGVATLAAALAGRLPQNEQAYGFALLLLCGLAFFAASALRQARGRRRYELAARRLSALELAAAEARAERYAATSCPVCLEEFTAGSGGAQAEKELSRSASGALAPARAQLGLRKELLRCGHAFCGPCLQRALASKPSCPVCRAPADGSEPPAPRAPPPPGAPPPAGCGAEEGAPAPPAARDLEAFLPELHFRLRRLQALHPDVVTHGMVDRWVARAREGGFAADPSFTRANPARAREGAAAAARSPSPRFAGGSSSSGRGGGW